MSDIDFTFAVARIRSLENSLLNATAIEQLIACPTEEKGTGGGGRPRRTQGSGDSSPSGAPCDPLRKRGRGGRHPQRRTGGALQV